MDVRYPLYALGLVVAAPALAGLIIAVSLDRAGWTPWPWWGLWLAGDLGLTALGWAGVAVLAVLGRLRRRTGPVVTDPPSA